MTQPKTSPTRASGRDKIAAARQKPALDAAAVAAGLAQRLPRPMPVAVRVSGRAKNVVLRMLPGRGLEVVAPAGVGAHTLAQAVDARREWIAAVFDRLAAEGVTVGPAAPGIRPTRLVLTAFGREWGVSYAAREGVGGCTLLVRGPGQVAVTGAVDDPAAVAAALAAFCRDRAGELLHPALAAVSRESGLAYTGLTVRAQRTRWGSCTAKGRISLNFTLAFLPWELCRLVLCHELCHTVELNHSSRFWNLLERHVPGCRELDARLSAARHHLPGWLGAASGSGVS
ncbi:M48 family metallopeptidase [Solidesulfovibrio sp.]